MKKIFSLFSFGVLFCFALFLVFFDFDTDEIVVAVLDTGINSEHRVFEGKLLEGYNFNSMNTDTTDTEGHGSGMAGLVIQQSEEAKILPVKVLGGKNYFSISMGIMYSIFKGADVVNMSLSTHGIESPFITLAIKYGQSKDVIFVASAGNDNKDEISFPANVKGVYAIGNVDYQGRFSDTSNYGDTIDFVSNGKRGALPSHIDNYKYGGNMSGTSLSTARVSGYIAYLMETEPEITPEKVHRKLLEKSKTITVQTDVGVKEFKELHRRYIKPYNTYSTNKTDVNS